MTAEEFFTNKPKPTFLEENPKSCDDYDREMLTQFCYDAGLEDDEIEPTVQSLIDWKNKRAEEYADLKAKEAQSKLRNLLEGLQAENVEELLNIASIEFFRLYGEVYFGAIVNKVESKAKEAFTAAAEMHTDHREQWDSMEPITYEQWKQSNQEQ